jgi:biotin transport system substrate-specific component
MSQAVADRANHGLTPFLQARLSDAGLVVSGSLLMAICAHVSIPLWFTPVPITLQTFGVLFLALALGGWRASAALVLYLLEGISGLPVFSPHGYGSILGPTGGYLMSYPFAALAAGLLAERITKRSRWIAYALSGIICEIVIFAAGGLWLMVLTHRSPGQIFVAAVLPFLPGEVLKASAAIAAALSSRKMLR